MRDDFMTERELCHLLKVSRSSLFNLRAKHALPFSKLGGSIRYSRDSVDQWMKQNELPLARDTSGSGGEPTSTKTSSTPKGGN